MSEPQQRSLAAIWLPVLITLTFVFGWWWRRRKYTPEVSTPPCASVKVADVLIDIASLCSQLANIQVSEALLSVFVNGNDKLGIRDVDLRRVCVDCKPTPTPASTPPTPYTLVHPAGVKWDLAPTHASLKQRTLTLTIGLTINGQTVHLTI